MKINLVVTYTFVACLYLSEAIEVDIAAGIDTDVDRRKNSISPYSQFSGKDGRKKKRFTKSVRDKNDSESANFKTNLGAYYEEGCDSYTKATDFYKKVSLFTWVDIECYSLTGGDGYNLQLIRIKRKVAVPRFDFPLHLVHNWGASSDVWTYREKSTLTDGGTAESAGMYLVNIGYDVWMSNMRGNGYSYSHEEYSRSCEEFWDFSWGDIAYWDLPSEWELIEHITNEEPIAIGNGMGAQAIAAALGAFENDYGGNDPKLVKGVILSNLITNMVRDSSCTDPDQCNKIYSDALDDADNRESRTLYNSLQCNGFLVQGIDTTGDDDYRSDWRCGDETELEKLEDFFTEDVAGQYGITASGAGKTDLFEPIVARATSKEIVHRLQNAKPTVSDQGKFYDFDEGSSRRNQKVYCSNNPPKYQGTDLANYYVAFFGGYNENKSLGLAEIGPGDNARQYCGIASKVWSENIGGTEFQYFEYGNLLMDFYDLERSGPIEAWRLIDLAITGMRNDATAEFIAPGTCNLRPV